MGRTISIVHDPRRALRAGLLSLHRAQSCPGKQGRSSGDVSLSSYRANAQGEVSALLTPHPHYTELGGDDKGRKITYRGLFHEQLDPETVEEIRAATNGNFALGSSKFQAQVAAALGRRVTPGRSGRPRKNKKPASLHLFDEE